VSLEKFLSVKIKTLLSFETSGTTRLTTQCHLPLDFSLQQHCNENLKSLHNRSYWFALKTQNFLRLCVFSPKCLNMNIVSRMVELRKNMEETASEYHGTQTGDLPSRDC
jgi:hypothetical protein